MEQPADWGYAKNKDTRSRNYIILGNSFNSNPLAFNFSKTEKLNVFSNTFSETEVDFKLDSTVIELDMLIDLQMAAKFDEDSAVIIPEVSNPADPFKGTGYLAGRKNILITEWGPYDFRSPVIWNTNPTDSSEIMKFDLLGPKGKWRIKSFKGLKDISAMSGIYPATITASKISGNNSEIFIQLEYVGEKIITPFGKVIASGQPYSFSFKRFFQPINFTVRWFGLDTATYNPIRTGQLFPPNVRVRPVKTEETDKLDYAWWGGIKGDEQYKQFITIAEGEAVIDKGEYELGITWDDAVKVYVDGKLLINEWNPSLYKFDESPHKNVRIALGGKHSFLVEHIELGGFACLSLKLTKINPGK
jgi:hypothetical protein